MKSTIMILVVALAATPTFAAETILDEMLESLAGEGTRGRSVETDVAAAFETVRRALYPAGADDVVIQEFDGPDGSTLRNAIALEPGGDPDAGWIVVGAHYDHLGLGEPGDANRGRIHPGADDNASGCAILAAMIDRWHADFADLNDRGVAFVFFDGEEIGLLGSRHFAANPPAAMGEIVAMINLDTVGRLADGGLTVFGSETGSGIADAIRGIDSGFGLGVDLVERSSGASDDMAFTEAGTPAVHLFTGAHPTYHRPSDTLETLDREGMRTIADFSLELVDYLARADVEITFVPPGATKALADPERATEGRRRVSLGTIPDFSGGEGEGVPITGVIPGSPAEKAGMEAGDVVVGFGGGPVADLTDYSEALKRHAPGDEVTVEFVRDGETRTVTVTLVERR